MTIGYKKPTRNKKRAVTLLFLLVITLIAGGSLHTQFVARAFDYNASLGTPLFGHIYPPWQGLLWHLQGAATYPHLFQENLEMAAYLATGFYLFILLIALAYNPTTKGNETLHGTAKFADYKEIKKTGLLDRLIDSKTGEAAKNAVVVGGVSKGAEVQYLYHRGPEHILAFAPSRSGKGVSLMLPTLFTWLGSAIILDIKGEAWAFTAGWRKHHAKNKVLKFDPTDESDSGARFNPLEEIRIHSQNDVADAQSMSKTIVNPLDTDKGRLDHWDKTAENFLAGAVLFVLYFFEKEYNTAPSMNDLAHSLADPNREDPDTFFQEMIEGDYYNGSSHPFVASAARSMLNKPERERGSVLSTAESNLQLYFDPILTKNISNSTFKIDDLMNHESAVSLYLVIRPSDKERLMPFIKIMLSLFTVKFTRKMEFKNGKTVKGYKHELLLLLDEFTSLGTMLPLENKLAYVAGYGVKCYIIIQDIKQLYRYYGDKESITQNCHVRISFAANDDSTANLLSRLTGETTVVTKQVSASGSRMSTMLGKVSYHYTETKRPLLTPDEITRLPIATKDNYGQILEPGKMLVFIAGHHPILGTQSLFFKDHIFLARSQVKPPVESDVC